jgi:hypothetical protein
MIRSNQEAADGFAGPTFTLADFSHWLLSPANDIFNAEHDQLCDDMTHPLSAYWINSSHNTCVLAGPEYRAREKEGGTLRWIFK